ncbi:MAG: L,D-transpeptidase/peptidoglycan binding protein [Lachnospiraceae bacterium]|nr:L,D-transpeptidase/peptidoglycan binding protein [Lachnospiraceae bacterium]
MKKKNIIIFMVFMIIYMMTGCKTEDKGEAIAKATEANSQESVSENVNKSGAIMQTEEKTTPLDPKEELKTNIAAMQITYNFDEAKEVLDGGVISDWLIDLPDGSISVNETPVKEYVASLAKKYDSFGQTRSFTTHNGDTVEVSGGDYGYWMDRVGTRQKLIEQILTGTSAELTPVYYGTAKKYGKDDIGNTYVEINLGDQHLWIYKDGEMINESDFVSGGLFKGNGTPEGTYCITYKERDATLVGQGYESSVKYWMPFNGNIGMHDASWRDTFGGHIYYMNGSHGCINLPTSAAEKIYDQVEKGEPVIVYGGISKEEAIPTLTKEEQIKAAEKGYIPMTDELQAEIYKAQGIDPAVAAAAAAQAEALKQAEEYAAAVAAQQAAAQAALEAAAQGAAQ